MSTHPPAHVNEGDADGPTLIFQWQGRPWRVWRLALTIFASLVVHAAAFYLLQVAYTPTGSLQPPSAQVVLLSPDNPAEKASLDAWLKMADPALMTSAQAPAAQDILGQINFRYVPSYAAAPPAFKPLDPASIEADPVPERTRRPGPVFVAPDEFLPRLAGTPPPPGNAVADAPTRLVFRGQAARLAPVQLPPFQFTASQRSRPLEPTVYLVGVRHGGGSPWLFRQPATGESTISDAALDEAAREYLVHLVFTEPEASRNGDSTVVWGWATFYWGREIYR